MAVKALTVHDTVEYVSDLDPSKKKSKVPVDVNDPSKGMKEVVTIEDGATVFMLKPLDVFLNGFIYDNASTIHGSEGTSEVGIKTRINQTNIDTVRHGLAGFTNFTDAKGTPVPYETEEVFVNGIKYEVVTKKVLNALGLRLIQELATKIKNVSDVTADEEKN